MNEVDNYVDSSEHKELLTKLRSLVQSHDQLKEEYKWSMPVYTKNGKDVCYIKATKNGANIGFAKGSSLEDTENLLEGSGKDMRHIKVSNSQTLEEATDKINSLIEQAIALEN